MSRRAFHIVLPSAWDEHVRSRRAHWAPPSLAAEGLVHLSFAAELGSTLDAHFGGHDRVVVVEVDLEAVRDALRIEPPLATAPVRAGGSDMLFPHVYRRLHRDEILRRWTVERLDGAWCPPAIGPRPAEDDPPGDPPFTA